MIYVTHDRFETLSLAGEMVVLVQRPGRSNRAGARGVQPAGQS